MYQYQGLNDPTRLNATEWDEAEYVKALGKITTATFTLFDEELQPFSPDKPGPMVSFINAVVCFPYCFVARVADLS